MDDTKQNDKRDGGAMDLVHGAKKVIVIMEHISKSGESKIMHHCSLPLTGKAVVDRIITDMDVIDVTTEGLKLIELASGCTIEQVIAHTEAPLIISDELLEANY